MLLALAPFGEKLKVQKLKGTDAQRKHLENLGFVQDAEIEIISSTQTGLIVSIKGSRIALGTELTRRIQVVPSFQSLNEASQTPAFSPVVSPELA